MIEVNCVFNYVFIIILFSQFLGQLVTGIGLVARQKSGKCIFLLILFVFGRLRGECDSIYSFFSSKAIDIGQNNGVIDMNFFSATPSPLYFTLIYLYDCLDYTRQISSSDSIQFDILENRKKNMTFFLLTS